MKDWTGNTKTHSSTIGSSNHSLFERQNEDYYATDPRAINMLMELESFKSPIWEPACGEGHISKALEKFDKTVYSSDLIDRGYGHVIDFLKLPPGTTWVGDIITNPPYKYAKEFIYKSIEIIPMGNKIAMFLKLTFAEGKGRKELFKQFPPKRIYVSSSRINCAMNGDFEGQRITGGSAICYAWWIWEKGFEGSTELKWFN